MRERKRRLILASANTGKLRELRAMLEPVGFSVIAQTEFGIEPVDETGASFVENALLKARAAATGSGLPALADDSGLAVDALDGRPGVLSARYAGADADDDDNNRLLLRELQDVPENARGAHYCCALVLLRHPTDPMPLCCFGGWHGRILEAARGSGGFGYDPLFLLPELGLTAAELDAATKNRLSHRGKALRRLLSLLDEPS